MNRYSINKRYETVKTFKALSLLLFCLFVVFWWQLICGDLHGNNVLVGNASSKAEFCFEAVSLERDPLNKMGCVCFHGVLCGWRYGWLVFLIFVLPNKPK